MTVMSCAWEVGGHMSLLFVEYVFIGGSCWEIKAGLSLKG